MGTSKPDMRVFSSAIGDHAHYDQLLVKQFESESNWTISNVPGKAPITLAHFAEDTRQKLAAHFAEMPELTGQKFGDNRLMLTHLAYFLTVNSGRWHHTYDLPEDEIGYRLRMNLDIVRSNKRIVLQEDGHPLAEHYKIKSDHMPDGRGGVTLARYLQARPEDIALANHLMGRNKSVNRDPHTIDLLRPAVPELFGVDDSLIAKPLLQLRLNMRHRLEQWSYMLTPERKMELLGLVQEDLEAALIENPEIIDSIDEMIHVDGAEVSVLDCEPQIVLNTLIRPLLAQDEIDIDTRQLLLKRRPILEILTCNAKKDGDTALIVELNDIFGEYCRKLNVPIHELRHFGLAMIAHATDVDGQKMVELMT